MLQKGFLFLVYTNLLIALAAFSQTVLTYVLLGKDVNLHIALLEGASTLLFYNFTLWLSRPAQPQASPYARTRWVFAREVLLWANSMLAFVIMVYCMTQIHSLVTAYFLGVGLACLLYTVPIFRYHGKALGLRQFPMIKVFYIAFIWVLSCVGLPLIDLYSSGVRVHAADALFGGLLAYLFLVVCTLPFDIRDMEQDKSYGMLTLPVRYGRTAAIWICYSMLLIHAVLLFFWSTPTDTVKGALWICNVGVVLLWRGCIFRRAAAYHHVYLLDAVLILQVLLVYAAIC